jgi:8-amino-3,8-dideoxy-alpha-D-manno-octulosonate transaminase
MKNESASFIRNNPLPQEWHGAHYYGDEELEALKRVVKSKSPFRYYGFDLQHEVEKLEQEFANYIGRRYALGVSSGTAALQIALGAMGIGPGDEVLLPGYFWVSTVGAVVRAGAIPVLVDCDDSFSLAPDKIDEKITKHTKAIIVVHMGGVIGNIEEIVRIAAENNLKVLEDCAQAAGSSQFGKMAGAFGDMAIYSFQLNKHMTSGEGGMLVTDDEKLFKRSFAIHDLGYPRNSEGRLEFNIPEYQLWGLGARMSELTGAVARAQLKKLDMICANMRNAKNRIIDAVSDIKGMSPRPVIDRDGDAGSFLMLTFDQREMSLRFVEKLRESGIAADKDGMYPIHMDDWGLHLYFNIPSLVNKCGISKISPWELSENAASKAEYTKGTCPNLDSMAGRTIIICIASVLTEHDINDIIAGIRNASEKSQ